MVERERQRMRDQQGLLGHCKHSRQRSLPAVFSPGSKEVCLSPVYPGLTQMSEFLVPLEELTKVSQFGGEGAEGNIV